MKPVLGFIKRVYNGEPEEGVWIPWIGYIDEDSAWIIDYDERTAKIPTDGVKKIPPLRYLMLTAHIKLATKVYDKEEFLRYSSPTYFHRDVLDNPECYPNLTVEELLRLKRDPRKIFRSGEISHFEFSPLR